MKTLFSKLGIGSVLVLGASGFAADKTLTCYNSDASIIYHDWKLVSGPQPLDGTLVHSKKLLKNYKLILKVDEVVGGAVAINRMELEIDEKSKTSLHASGDPTAGKPSRSIYTVDGKVRWSIGKMREMVEEVRFTCDQEDPGAVP